MPEAHPDCLLCERRGPLRCAALRHGPDNTGEYPINSPHWRREVPVIAINPRRFKIRGAGITSLPNAHYWPQTHVDRCSCCGRWGKSSEVRRWAPKNVSISSDEKQRLFCWGCAEERRPIWETEIECAKSRAQIVALKREINGRKDNSERGTTP